MKVALIEFYPYHSELIHSQLLFLKQYNCEIILIGTSQNQKILQQYREYATIFTFDFRKFSSLLKLWFFLLTSKINHVIFNTAQGNIMLKFSMLWIPKSIKIAGIIHNTRKLVSSTGQKIISKKIKSYYVLADYMEHSFPQIKGIKQQHINCAYNPSFPKRKLNKASNEIWVTIPGSIEYKRRDYDFLLTLIEHKEKTQNIKFILLGNSSRFEGPLFIDKIKENGVENNFIWFESFVPNDLFYNYMIQSDFLLPLIHPSTPSANDYLKYKVSGTFIQSQAYSKLMICHQMFNQPGFSYPSKFYQNAEEFIQILKENKGTKQIVKPDFRTDSKNYFNFLMDA